MFDTSADASKYIAAEIANLIKTRAAKGENAVLGLATGSSPTKVYEELVRLHKEEGLSFKNVISFNLDEYYPMKPEKLQSYHRFMKEYLFEHIDILPENINIPDGTLKQDDIEEYCRNYEKKILECGGIDIQLCGIGRTGHIGFNEPGSSKHSKTRLIYLNKITMIDAADSFFGYENVPKMAITMGVGTVLNAKRVIIMAWSESKARIAAKAIEGSVVSEVSASFLQQHANAQFFLDRAAAEHLTRYRCPWVLKGETHEIEIEFDEPTVIKAVVWLSQTVGRPILRLRNEDYDMNGLAALLRKFGDSSKINIKVFSKLRDSITGWPAGGKPQNVDIPYNKAKSLSSKRIVVFSPHPDDDVICMGGTMCKLVRQGHEVHTCYQVSGNIAVFDHDARRFADFATEYAKAFGIDSERFDQIEAGVNKFLDTKEPAEVDSEDIQKIKNLIRRTEARNAAMACGLKRENIHFLDLPFYKTGTVKKKPLGEEDILIVKNFLDGIKPHYIYAAGDLTDPHGTHRVCLDSILNAFKLFEAEGTEWFKECETYLYRGSWQEWDPEKISVAVPMSPDELYEKRLAIFKHQSQKDPALFPGDDSREFWQRSEDRNKRTAKIFDSLGLTEYEAIEVFVNLKELRRFIKI